LRIFNASGMFCLSDVTRWPDGRTAPPGGRLVPVGSLAGVRLYFDDDGFDGQLQRSIGKADSGMANVGECLAVASQITPGDRDSWYRAWTAAGSRLTEQADAALAAGHAVSARGAYLRAAEYFRQAFFFHRDDLDGAELRAAYPASVQAFRAALPLLSHPARILSGALPGYLFIPDRTATPRPTILHIGGYDGTAEELYASAGPALERGYAFAAVDGPGQGSALYDQRTPMRPDWEHVVPGMVDHLITHPEVDPAKIVLVGRSFGGFLAPRGAAGESRLAAMIVDPGQYDLGTAATARLGDLGQRIDDPAADDQFTALLTLPALKALLAPRMVTHGKPAVRAYLADMLRYTNAPTITQITCPSYVTDNETDTVSTGQGKQLFDHLTCPKQFRLFTRAEGAEGHCEGMAPIVFWTAAFDWLDHTLA
jgi:dienelactone hydrolase